MARKPSDGVPLPVPPEQAQRALYELLVELFAGGGLERWARYSLGATAVADLPGPTVGLAALADKTVVIACSHGRLDAVFEALERERPGQLERIQEVKELFEFAPDHRPASAHVPRYPDEATKRLSTELAAAYRRRDLLHDLGADTEAVTAEILALRRQLRESGKLKPGDFLSNGRYALLEELGRGGFATVWKAHDTHAINPVDDSLVSSDLEIVAIKVMHTHLAHEASRRERFFRGARIMAELKNEAIVQVLAPYAEDGGYHYFVMELISGGTLRQAVADGRVTPANALSVVLAIGESVAVAHRAKLVHRDIKPDNVLMTADGRPKLTDFDLVGAEDTTGGTRTGAMGTFLYAAPEMLDRPQDADARADVYALGMTAIFALHGDKLPRSVLRNTDRLVARLPCSDAAKQVLLRAVDWNVEARYADAATLCETLREVIEADSHSQETGVTRVTQSEPIAHTVNAQLVRALQTPFVGVVRVPDSAGQRKAAQFEKRRQRETLRVVYGLGGGIVMGIAIVAIALSVASDSNENGDIAEESKSPEVIEDAYTLQDANIPVLDASTIDGMPEPEPTRAILSFDVSPAKLDVEITVDGAKVNGLTHEVALGESGTAWVEIVAKATGYRPFVYRHRVNQSDTITIALRKWSSGRPPTPKRGGPGDFIDLP